MSHAGLIFLLAIGGGSGALCRYLLGVSMMKKFPASRIPIAMIIVNIIGSFGLGVLYGNLGAENLFHDTLFVAVGLGFFGAFTTFSTFSVEAVQLVLDKKFAGALFYVGLSVLGSVLGFLFGYHLLSN